jgi:hypothetical protein
MLLFLQRASAIVFVLTAVLSRLWSSWSANLVFFLGVGILATVPPVCEVVHRRIARIGSRGDYWWVGFGLALDVVVVLFYLLHAGTIG